MLGKMGHIYLCENISWTTEICEAFVISSCLHLILRDSTIVDSWGGGIPCRVIHFRWDCRVQACIAYWRKRILANLIRCRYTWRFSNLSSIDACISVIIFSEKMFQCFCLMFFAEYHEIVRFFFSKIYIFWDMTYQLIFLNGTPCIFLWYWIFHIITFLKI